jgi:hypothetical protein
MWLWPSRPPTPPRTLCTRPPSCSAHSAHRSGSASCGSSRTAAVRSTSWSPQHLRVLRAARLVVGTRHARAVEYSLTDHHVAHIVLDALRHVQEDDPARDDSAHDDSAHDDSAHDDPAHEERAGPGSSTPATTLPGTPGTPSG